MNNKFENEQMKKLMNTSINRRALILVAVLILPACSVYKAASQAGPADLTGIGIGSPRQELISRLGTPKLVDTAENGSKQDVFEFSSGMHQAAKLRIIPYLAADVFTIGLAEAILWPLEISVMDSATCTGIATYDTKSKVSAWNVSSKKDSSMQKC